MEKRNLFITGGCRSGKSSYALREACRVGGENRIFLATSVPADPEMEHRVAAHRRERGNAWRTIEEPEAVGECIARLKKQVDVILVDCLTLWISNLLCSHNDEKYIKDRIEILVTALGSPGCPVFMVSNEVGCGIVPENSLSRAFRDMAGYANQKAAQTADRVIWMVSGIPVKIK
ncbi:MAG: bifunctional adenosylcobinamide kinase/adenosylcobinamide-phosphate guanylyltransferase [Desulfobacteraceae bacterium]